LKPESLGEETMMSRSSDTNPSTTGLPIACDLSEQEQQQRRRELAANIFRDFQQADELLDGYAFRFPGDEACSQRLLEFINFERRCCAFMTFELLFEPGQGSIWLRLRGAAGVKEFIRDEMQMIREPDITPKRE
jgi:hypothetical protein